MNELKETTQKLPEDSNPEKSTVRSKKTQKTIEIAGGAIFGALSIIIYGLISPIVNASRITGWGIALFDPVSWIWIICFLLFGPLAGLISCSIGSLGLFIFDVTGVGPAFKFFATIPMILVPTILLKLREKGVINSEKLKKPRNYFVTGAIGIAARVGLMVLLNVLFFLTIFADYFAYMNLEIIGLAGITGWSAILIFTPILNLFTAILDLIVPYLLVYPTKLDEKVDLW